MVKRGVCAAAALSLVVAGTGRSAPSIAGSVPVPVADAVVIDPGVEVRAGAAGTYSAVQTSTHVAEGDGVRTDATGFAEIAYLDGSRTRLDVNTEFDVVALVDDAGVSSTRTSMGIGRTWHRVESLGEAGGGFSVETSQATATVTGTAFAIECVSDAECSYGVIEGSLELTLPDGTVIDLAAPSVVNVVNGVADVVTPVPYDGVFGDPWLVDNAVRDVAAGFADPATIYQPYGSAYASMAGTFHVTGTITDQRCDSLCLEGPAVGDSIDYSFTFDSGDFDGSSHTFTADSEQACGFDDDGDGAIDRETGRLAASDVHTLTPTAVEVRTGIPQVTAFTGTLTTTWSVASGECFEGQFLGQTVTAAITGSR